MNHPAGWHIDPQNPAIDRYWDGRQWAGHIRPRVAGNAAAHGEPKKRRRWPIALGAGVIGAFVLGGMLGNSHETNDASAPVAVSSAKPSPSRTTTSPRPTTTTPAPVPAARIIADTTTVTTTPVTTAATTTTVVPAPTTTTRSVEYSCSSETWRESMGAEGDALCGSVWTPPTIPDHSGIHDGTGGGVHTYAGRGIHAGTSSLGPTRRRNGSSRLVLQHTRRGGRDEEGNTDGVCARFRRQGPLAIAIAD